MKTLVQLAIVGALIAWLACFGGWAKVCDFINGLQAGNGGSKKQSEVAKGAKNALNRENHMNRMINLGGGDQE